MKEHTLKAIIEYFNANEDTFVECVEELDSYNGYLGDDRYYGMEFLNELYQGTEPLELLNRVYYGRDDDTWTTDSHGEKTYGEFNPNREYFYYNGFKTLLCVCADFGQRKSPFSGLPCLVLGWDIVEFRGLKRFFL